MAFTFNNGCNVDVDVYVDAAGTPVITSVPASGEYQIKELRLDASKHIVVVYDETPEP